MLETFETRKRYRNEARLASDETDEIVTDAQVSLLECKQRLAPLGAPGRRVQATMTRAVQELEVALRLLLDEAAS